MATDVEENESVKSFLNRIKLAEKYADVFEQKGYLTVNDCFGITEETLKNIGVTLPGHYRRILSKLPGCSVKKPPRPNRVSSLDSEGLLKTSVDHSPVEADAFEPEDFYEIDRSSEVIERNHKEIGDSMTSKTFSFPSAADQRTNSCSGAPRKPPRSPENVRKSFALSPQILDENPFDNAPKSPTTPLDVLNPINSPAQARSGSPSSISMAVDLILRDVAKQRTPVESPEELPLDGATWFTPGVSSIAHQSASVQLDAGTDGTQVTEAYNLLSTEASVVNMPLPSPPPPAWSASREEEVTLPSPPPHPNTGFWDDEPQAIADDEGAYDRLSITKCGATNFEATVVKDISSTVGVTHDLRNDDYETFNNSTNSPKKCGHTPNTAVLKRNSSTNLQIPPARMPAYEEITLLRIGPSSPTISVPLQTNGDDDNTLHDQRIYEEAFLPITSMPLPATPQATDNGEAGAEQSCTLMLQPAIETGFAVRKNANDTSVGRSKSFDIYDIATNSDASIASSSENVYDNCGADTKSNVVAKKAKQILNDLKKSASLPRSSGSLPAGSMNPRAGSTAVLPRSSQRRSPVSNLSDNSSDADLYDRTSDLHEIGEDDDLYQSIGEATNQIKKADSKNRRSQSGGSVLLTKSRLRLGRKGHVRPLSAIVDNIRSGQNMRPGSSDESLDTCGDEGNKVHKRTVSIGDGRYGSSGSFSSADLVDAQLMEENRRSTSEQQALPQSPLFKKKTKKGWLYKHGGHEGRAPLRKRWVVFDGDELAYYESEHKMELSKGIIPVDVILRVQVANGEPKVFHISTKGGRKYAFNAESSEEKTLWTSTLLAAKMRYEKQNQGGHFKPGGSMYMPYKEGLLKMDGSRQKTYLATKGEQLAYYKSNHEFNFGQPVAKLSMKIATVKDIDKKKFQIVFPFRTFTFTADNEDEKRTWVEALKEAIAEGLSDYKVIKEVWTCEPNRKCADCGREDPDWASINLAIVICKHCAGVHRDLGVHNSKVRSLKMDVKIWNDTMKSLLFMLGNDVANSFWGAKLKSSDAITDMADKKQRSWHITSKYLEMQYLEPHKYAGNQELINQSLIDAVRHNDLREAYMLIFSGADPNCATGKEHAKTPFLLSKYLGYHILAEFLSQNGATSDVSPQGHITNRSNCVTKKDSLPKSRVKPPVMLKDNLYKYGGDFKNTPEERKQSRSRGLIRSALQQGEFQKRMCVLENNVFKYYDPERTSILKDEVECSELISIGICQPELATKAGYQHCFEVSRSTGRTYLFCAERKEIASKWTRGLMQAIVPPHVQNAMKHDMEYDRIGKLWIKSQHWARKSSDWVSTWCRLKGKILYYFHNDSLTMESIDLRRLVQLSLDLTQDGSTAGSAGQNNKEPVPTFMLVFREKSYYLRSDTKPDSESWLAAIKKADSDCGPELTDQQLTAEGVPITLEKCTTYVEQFGLITRGIYRLSGTHSKTTQLLSDFRQNARETQMRDAELNVHDVANALKRWFKSLPGSLLTSELHEQWIDTSQIKQEHHHRKLEWYKHLIEKLPDINRNTLKVLLVHLNNVASHEKENEMSIHNLAIVFGPTLMEPQGAEDGKKFIGQTSQEIGCIEDLLKYYDWLFDVTEVDREKERLILEAKEKISIAKQQQNMLTTLDYDMMVPIYINSKDEKCVNYKVNMNAGELIAQICRTHGYPAKTWGLFEVISDGDAERPLHYSEHVLSVIKAWEMPSTNYLLAKHDYVRDKLRWLKAPSGGGMDLLYEGPVKVYETKKKWMRMSASLKVADGGLTMSYVKNQDGSTSVRDVASGNWRKRSTRVQHTIRRTAGSFDVKGATSISLGVYHAYIGLDKKTKPPTSKNCGFTLANRGEVTKYFAVDSETHLYKWIGHILHYKYPDGFTPSSSPAISPLGVATPPRSDTGNNKRFAFPTFSQQDLSEAAMAVALQRMSSTSSDEVTRENPNEVATAAEDPQHDSTALSQDQVAMPPPSARPQSLGQLDTSTATTTNANARRSQFVTSPIDQKRAGGFLGLKLQSELSSVLKKRTQ